MSLPPLTIIHEPSCPICFDDYEIGVEYDCTLFPCNHFVCSECALDIFKSAQNNQINCPICRAVVVLPSDESDFCWSSSIKTANLIKFAIGISFTFGIFILITSVCFNNFKEDRDLSSYHSSWRYYGGISLVMSGSLTLFLMKQMNQKKLSARKIKYVSLPKNTILNV